MPTPLTDAINALMTYSNEVTGESDTTLSDAVHTLASGYGQGGVNYLNYAKRLASLFVSSTDLPQKIEFAPIQLDSGVNVNGYFIYRAYESGQNIPTIDLSIHFGQTTPFSLKELLFQAYGVKFLKISGNLQYCTSYNNIIQYCTFLRTLDMVFDFSSISSDTDGNIYTGGPDNNYITNVRFAPNTARYNVSISKLAAIDDMSIVSAANCLVAGISGKTLGLHAMPKARCSTLMGINDNGTFVIDENGTMTLADFITNVKGWTLE